MMPRAQNLPEAGPRIVVAHAVDLSRAMSAGEIAYGSGGELVSTDRSVVRHVTTKDDKIQWPQSRTVAEHQGQATTSIHAVRKRLARAVDMSVREMQNAHARTLPTRASRSPGPGARRELDSPQALGH
jgi:hypothetical protein